MYNEYKLIINKKILDKKEEINELRRIIYTSEKDKPFVRTKKTNELLQLYLDQLNEKIKKLKEEIDDLENSFHDSKKVFSLFTKNLNLDDSDINFFHYKLGDNDKKVITNIKDIVLINKTDISPKDGIMHINNEINNLIKENVKINDEIYHIEYEVENDINHFTLNGVVNNSLYRSLKDCKFGIILSLESLNKDNLLSLSPEDTCVMKKIKLHKDSIIVCPDDEKDCVKNQNPNVTVIGYEKDKMNLDDAIKCILIYKEYKIKQITQKGWIDEEFNDSEILQKLKEDLNINKEKDLYLENKELLSYGVKRLTEIIKIIINNNIIDVNIDNLRFFGKYDKKYIKDYLLQFEKNMIKSNHNIDYNKLGQELLNLNELITNSDDNTFDLKEINSYLIDVVLKVNLNDNYKRLK